MAESPLVTDELKALVGKEVSSVSYQVSKEDIKKLAFAVGDMNPLYLDEEAARKSRYGGIIAPPMQYFITTYGVQPQTSLTPDGRPEFLRLPMKFTGVIFGGAEVGFHVPLRPGDTVTAKRRIIEITNKESTKRGWMAPVTFETRYTNQKDELVAVTRETSVYF